MTGSRKPVRVGRRATWLALSAALALSPLPVLAQSTSNGDVAAERRSSGEQNGVALMRIVVPDQAGVDRLNDLGIDLAEYSKPVDGGIEVHAVLSPEETRDLRGKGFDVR